MFPVNTNQNPKFSTTAPASAISSIENFENQTIFWCHLLQRHFRLFVIKYCKCIWKMLALFIFQTSHETSKSNENCFGSHKDSVVTENNQTLTTFVHWNVRTSIMLRKPWQDKELFNWKANKLIGNNSFKYPFARMRLK